MRVGVRATVIHAYSIPPPHVYPTPFRVGVRATVRIRITVGIMTMVRVRIAVRASVRVV